VVSDSKKPPLLSVLRSLKIDVPTTPILNNIKDTIENVKNVIDKPINKHFLT